ncbi:hypothetical protein EDB81DRAFT_310431 [Dactylonectria macrodidyma]|uniref:Uncharacterized protein n=1 Tax=Dactylonectria macrodidyma TaxID=307937 RepID=A0A9P9D3V6_9HYPO|nr:hypothetical protein EDB81DRAFT_310431 [Dactylonectria macrodidyma]
MPMLETITKFYKTYQTIKLSNYQTIRDETYPIKSVQQRTIPMSSTFTSKYLYIYISRMKWEIWGVKAPVIEDSKASFNHQTCNHQSRMKWEIWGVKAPVTRESKGYSPHKLIYQAIRETWGAKALVTKQSNASVVIEALSCFSPTKVFLRF